MIMSNCSSIFKCMRNHVNSHNTIFRTIIVYKDIQYFIIYMYMSIIFNSHMAIFEYHEKCSSKYWKLKWMLYHYIKKYPSVCISKYSLQRTTVYALSAIFKIFLWLRRKLQYRTVIHWDGSFIYYWMFWLFLQYFSWNFNQLVLFQLISKSWFGALHCNLSE